MNSAPQPFFLGHADGFDSPRFAILNTPPTGIPLAGALLFLAPPGEEMNRSRRMVSLQARALAEQGWAVLQIDLKGCGDSDGTLEHATWARWVQDAVQAHAWLQARTGGTPWLWGLRHGALLAVAAAKQLPEPPPLLLWHPVAEGAATLRQWLRMGAGARHSAAELRQRLDAGENVDIAGYTLSPCMAQAWASCTLAPPERPDALPATVLWFDVSPDGAALPGHGPWLAQWREAGWDAQHHTLHGPGFWSTTETSVAPNLLMATAHAFAAQARCSQAQGSATIATPTWPVPEAMRLGEAVDETPFAFAGSLHEGKPALIGIASRPASEPHSGLGLVLVVGGPQVRTGAHRLYTLLARRLAAQGHAVLRFDLQGMGDSQGEPLGFDQRDGDLAAATQAMQQVDPQVRRVLLWGLCDGASAALLYAGGTEGAKLGGVCLVNPWARNPVSLAQTRLTHHYRTRLVSPSFWWRALRGRVSPKALSGWLRASWQARRRNTLPGAHFTARMAAALSQAAQSGDAAKPMHLISAGADETAQEFLTFLRTDAPGGQTLLTQAVRHDADHTFSKPGQAEWLCQTTHAWLQTQAVARANEAAP